MILFLFFCSCSKSNDAENKKEQAALTETQVDLQTHKLSAYTVSQTSKYLTVLESGLGDDHSVWEEKEMIYKMGKLTSVLSYDRAGYGKSGTGPGPRNINRLRTELEAVISRFSENRKVILIGHSLGGMVIRDYAVKNPSKVAGLLFIDPSHEDYNRPSREEEDFLYNQMKAAAGPNFGGTQEARCLIEDSEYTSSLPGLPDVPVIVISSMKTDAQHSASDRKKWFDAHESLKKGIKDFSHIATTRSGHYIMNDEPDLVMENFKSLLGKLP